MDNTIAGISTAYGEGGIGIIRISGNNSLDIAKKIFTNSHKLENRKLIYGHIKDGDIIIDEVLTVYMKTPKTYTGEDIVEIHCHGSIVSLHRILDLVIKNGAELADRGEFTKRAFLNGKMDLSQAEAVIDIIKAKNVPAFDIAMNQSKGLLGEEIRSIRKLLVDVLVNIAVNIDYPDEDIEEIVYSKLKNELQNIKDRVSTLVDTSKDGKIIKEGITISIIGKPNVGKSSLMNVLLKEERAIVTDIAGTTRDIIKEDILIDDIPITLIDTAGMRSTDDTIEKIGIEKSKESFNISDLIIYIVDSSKKLEKEDFEIIDALSDKKVIVLLNKIDLKKIVDVGYLKDNIRNSRFIETSMTDLIGIDELKKVVKDMIFSGKVYQENSIVITNVRHENLLIEAYNSLVDGINLVSLDEALELVEIDVNRAYESLGEIIGEEVKDDILDEVFSRFCLGK